MNIMSNENSRLVQYSLGGIVGLIAAGYIAPHLNSNVYELVGGLAILGGTFYLIKGTEGIKGPIKLFGAVVGVLFTIRGVLGFVPSVQAQVAQLTYNIL